MAPTIFFTVIIRTYNASEHIATILERLKAQIHVEKISWDVLIVDNNSTDNTMDIVSHYQAMWPLGYPLRWVREPRQGASYARRRGIQEAEGQWVGFLDDDTWPALDWVFSVCEFVKNHPKAGAINGNIYGCFEGSPPEGFEKISPYFAVIEKRAKVAYCINDKLYAHKVIMPPGAGLVVQKKAWLESVPASLVLKGPVGSALTAKGEDVEALMYLSRHGWEIWFNPEQCIEHYIPQSRFERRYLLRFFKGIGLGRYHTRILAYPSWYGVLMVPIYFINDLRKLILFWMRYHHQFTQDVISESQMQMLLYTIVSPFYLMVNGMGALLSGVGRNKYEK